MARIEFLDHPAFAQPEYELLPFRFARMSPGKVLLSSEAGDWDIVQDSEFNALLAGSLAGPKRHDLEAKQILVSGSMDLAVRVAAAKVRSRKAFLRGGPSLHIFVVTLRCNHSCHYCQVSRALESAGQFDMSWATAQQAIDRIFEVPSPTITVEFQGGEPLLAGDLIERITEKIAERAARSGKIVTFAITSTLHHLTPPLLELFRAHQFQISTSLDGPQWLHDANRPCGGESSYRRTVDGIRLARDAVGDDAVSALTTLTRLSLHHPEAIVDEYVDQGFRSVFLRPLSPYGFAVRSDAKIGYGLSDFLGFYHKGVEHILRRNRAGTPIAEAYAGILLTSIMSPFATSYVDLRSPAGAGLGTLVYNYDGEVYASDEGRMLAETGDHTFRVGHVSQNYHALLKAPIIAELLDAGIAEAAPGCSECAFVPFCGSDPVHDYARTGQMRPPRHLSWHCQKHLAFFHYLFGLLDRADDETKRMLFSWTQAYHPANGTPS